MSAHYQQWHALPTMQAGDMYRFPRTVVEAYPCDLNHDIHTAYEPMETRDKWVIATSLLGLVVLCILGALK